MNEKLSTISVKDFYELGFLQELNRLFLHPRGLALSVSIDDETGSVSFGEIHDYRHDPEGILYGDNTLSWQKHKNVEDERKKHEDTRVKLFKGTTIQPLTRKNTIDSFDEVFPEADEIVEKTKKAIRDTELSAKPQERKEAKKRSRKRRRS